MHFDETGIICIGANKKNSKKLVQKGVKNCWILPVASTHAHSHSVGIDALRWILCVTAVAVAYVWWVAFVVAVGALCWCLAVGAVLVLGIDGLCVGYSNCRHDYQRQRQDDEDDFCFGHFTFHLKHTMGYGWFEGWLKQF